MWNNVVEVRLIFRARCARLVEKLNLGCQIGNPLRISADRTGTRISDSPITTKNPDIAIRSVEHHLKFPLRRVRSFAPQRIDVRARRITHGEWRQDPILSFEEVPIRQRSTQDFRILPEDPD